MAQIRDPKLRFSIAEQGLENLAKGLGGLIRDTQALITGSGFSEEVLAIGQSFQSQMKALQSVANEASEIMERARAAAGDGEPKLSEDDAQKLEALNERAGRAQESIVELMKQLRFRNPKDDDGPPGASGAAPMIPIAVGNA